MKSAKIFLVEDDLSFGSVLKSYLELNDFQVDWVDDGKYAVEHFRKGAFDICILDVMLPHVDGFTIAGEIRKINNMVPIVFLAKNLGRVLKGYGSVAMIRTNHLIMKFFWQRYALSFPDVIFKPAQKIFLKLVNSYSMPSSERSPAVTMKRSCHPRRLSCSSFWLSIRMN
jgi:CheY-like chemotaxis protein